VLIGELAERSGVPPKTLRYYEDIAVLSRPERTAAGYRVYDEGALHRLAFIRSAQAAGLTLAEIRDVIGLRERGVVPCGHVVELIDEKRARVASQIAELHELQQELDRIREWADGLDSGTCDPRLVCQVLTGPSGDGGTDIAVHPRTPRRDT
jgi:DNA-binding transcriptional MerR regulator